MKFICILALLNASSLANLHFRNHRAASVRNYGGGNSFGNYGGNSNNGGNYGGNYGDYNGGNNGTPLDFKANECSEGVQYCDRSPTQFWVCDHGKLTKLTCFTNTQCNQKGYNSIECKYY